MPAVVAARGSSDRMSAPAFVWAIEQGERHQLPTSARMLLVYLANKANGELEAWPGQALIARMTGLNEKSVRRLTKLLVVAGLIEVGKRGKVVTYRIKREGGGGNGHRTPCPVSRRRTPGTMSGVRRSKPD